MSNIIEEKLKDPNGNVIVDFKNKVTFLGKSGPVVLEQEPVKPREATTKGYVDVPPDFSEVLTKETTFHITHNGKRFKVPLSVLAAYLGSLGGGTGDPSGGGTGDPSGGDVLQGVLYTLGTNKDGQLGVGVNPSFSADLREVAVDRLFQAAISGRNHMLALDLEGLLFSWGANDYGELGRIPDGESDRIFPNQVGNKKWKQIAAVQFSSMAIDENGYLYGWGYSNNYNIGLADGNYNTPTQVGQKKWKKVILCGHIGFGIDENDHLYGWGDFRYGQLGNGIKQGSTGPVRISDLTWDMVAAGGGTDGGPSAGITKDGDLYVWGRSSDVSDFLGDPNRYDYLHPEEIYVPQKLDDQKYKSVACGSNFILAVTIDGLLYAWGDNYFGQLGTGDTYDTIYPKKIGNLKWEKVCASLHNSCGLTEDGGLYAWGDDFRYKNPQRLGADTFLDFHVCSGNIIAIREELTGENPGEMPA